MQKSLQLKRALHTALLVLLFGVVGMGKGYAQNYDFSAACPIGQALYYSIISVDNVALVAPGYSNGIGSNPSHPSWVVFIQPAGSIVLSEIVEYEGINYTLTIIGDYAFGSYNDLTGDLTIPNSVTTIGRSAFSGCSGLTGSLTISNVTKKVSVSR